MDLTFFLLLLVSFLFICACGGILFWAIFSGQYDNSEKNANSVFLDDDSTSDIAKK
ncbi:cbb3-type cytochrome oxidase assembly protein CcoS [Basilea psittacipulmonis]|uniref:cbb3-type cytochrome oxidase assembly protein CcoS n=1 Tax=Basilea psittacipulmonis TaxID=1472345 RepID=UPI000987B174|nr:cbb3-type cytochrome oxidase assembly protein CcoS [Basilea psittacipulmonis]